VPICNKHHQAALVMQNGRKSTRKESNMTKQDLSEIVCIVDRSGSMDMIRYDSIGGFNAFLYEQKKLPGEARFTLVLFNHEYIVLHDGKNIHDIPPLDDNTYVPQGNTALLDAIGIALVTVGERLNNTPENERPRKVIVAILTDGEENASRQYNRKRIMEMINNQRDTYSWEFVFLAANQDAIREGQTFGLQAKDSFNFAATKKGIKHAFGSLNSSVTCLRSKL
jgi:hypothetical protein